MSENKNNKNDNNADSWLLKSILLMQVSLIGGLVIAGGVSLVHDEMNKDKIFDNLDKETITASEAANTNVSNFCKEMKDMSEQLSNRAKMTSSNNDLYILPVKECEKVTEALANSGAQKKVAPYNQKMTQSTNGL